MLIQSYKITRRSTDFSYSFFVATLLCSEIYGVFQTCHFQHNPDLDDLSTSSWMFREVSLDSSSSNFECAFQCMRESSCVTYMVNRNTRLCRMYGVKISIKNQLSSQPGFQTYDTCRAGSVVGSSCQSSLDCGLANSACFGNTCQCDRGWTYSPNDRQCVKDCTAWGNDFAVYPGYVLNGYDDFRFMLPKPEELTPEKCMEACINHTDFVCRSFDWERNLYCHLSKTSFLEHPTYFFTNTFVDPQAKQYYQRLCKYMN